MSANNPPGPYDPPPYQPPAPAPYTQGYGYPSPYSTRRPPSGLAVAALVCGIVGIVGSPLIAFLLVPVLVPLAAVVLGHMARAQIRRDPGLGGSGMALTGLILGYVPLAISLLLVIAAVVFGVALLGTVATSPVSFS
ncbi:DUF4190 domain-containing protein [Microbacterium sp. USHLN186]|uniref:DUF4190 domain-containing protein n=1 Tax=Microbacterium sp. USHLN186 TaxID=3081286 RepID=UPI0030164B98